MGWANYFFLGDLGQQLDISNINNKLDELSQDQSWVDRTQDQRLADLERENRELKVWVGVVVRILIRKGVLSADEVATLVRELKVDTTR